MKSEKWVEQFDEEFPEVAVVDEKNPVNDGDGAILASPNEIKSFIKSLLSSQREELLKKIRDRLVAESTIGEHTIKVFDDILTDLAKELK